MPAPARLPGKEVHVLAHAAEVRIVVLRDQRDAQRALIVRIRQGRKIRERWPALKRGATGRRSQKQRRLVDRYAVREARDLIEPTRAKNDSRSWALHRATPSMPLRLAGARIPFRSACVISDPARAGSRRQNGRWPPACTSRAVNTHNRSATCPDRLAEPWDSRPKNRHDRSRADPLAPTPTSHRARGSRANRHRAKPESPRACDWRR